MYVVLRVGAIPSNLVEERVFQGPSWRWGWQKASLRGKCLSDVKQQANFLFNRADIVLLVFRPSVIERADRLTHDSTYGASNLWLWEQALFDFD